jgi:acyl carrier protein
MQGSEIKEDSPVEIARGTLAEVLELNSSEVDINANLGGDLGVDSLALIETLVVIEERHGIVMPQPDELLELGVSTVADLGEVIARAKYGNND